MGFLLGASGLSLMLMTNEEKGLSSYKHASASHADISLCLMNLLSKFGTDCPHLG